MTDGYRPIGAFDLYACTACGGVVVADTRPTHTAWHESIRTVTTVADPRGPFQPQT